MSSSDVRQLVAAAERLLQLEITPQELRYETSCNGPRLTVKFSSEADLQAWAALDKAQVEFSDHTSTGGFQHYWALYDRPGRRVLAEAKLFPHQRAQPPGGQQLQRQVDADR